MTRTETVSFGSRRSGLSTVGYTLVNTDGSTKQARTTSGVVEVSSGSGVYGASITFDDSWTGFIVWDTGEATPLVAATSYNETQATGGDSGGVGFIQTGFNEEDKEKILKQLKKILLMLKEIAGKDNSDIQESIFNVKREIRDLNENTEKIVNKEPEISKAQINEMAESIKLLSRAMCLMLESSQFQNLKTEAKENVSADINRLTNKYKLF